MKTLIEKIVSGQLLTYDESKSFIYAISEGSLSTEHTVVLLTGLQMRGVQLPEISGFRDALLELTKPLELDSSEAIDLCGTGGDGKNTFNISTTTAMVLAAMGKKVIKHGNYGVSSGCGSSNVVEALGFSFSDDQRELERQLNTTNLCFLHAPLFHPTLKQVAPVRKNLGIRTLFNSLGPLVNPVQPAYQISGTYSLELAHIYRHLLQHQRKNFKVVYGMSGYDELTLTDTTRILEKTTENTVSAADYQLEKIHPLAIEAGKTVEASAEIVRAILKGEASAEQMHVIAANVAEALHCFEPAAERIDLFHEAQAFIRSGQAARHFSMN